MVPNKPYGPGVPGTGHRGGPWSFGTRWVSTLDGPVATKLSSYVGRLPPWDAEWCSARQVNGTGTDEVKAEVRFSHGADGREVSVTQTLKLVIGQTLEVRGGQAMPCTVAWVGTTAAAAGGRAGQPGARRRPPCSARVSVAW